MSETSSVRSIRPQTDLVSYAGAAPQGFQRYLKDFLDREEEAAIAATMNRINDSTIDQIERNDNIPFIADVTPHPVTGTSRFLLHVNADDAESHHIQRNYGIYEDHRVAVFCYNNVDDAEFDVYEGSVTRISSNSFKVDLDIENRERSSVQQVVENATHTGVASVFNPLVFDRERAAIEKLPDKSHFWNVLTGQRPITFDDDAAANSEALDEALYENQKQAIAINDALQASDAYCIQGPPGTGKTRVIRELVRRLVAAGCQVLVTAETNTAVDNILMGSGNHRPDDSSLLTYAEGHGRSSGGLTVARNNRSNSKREYIRSNVGQSSATADVVCSTNNSAHHLAERDREFDVLVTDEAAQARKTSTFIPLQLVERAVFVGDHKQLPATRQSNRLNENDGRHLSVFEHLYDGLYPEEVGIRLDTQYRMVPDLIEFSDQEFYDGTIRTGSDHDSVMSQPIGLIDINATHGEESVDTSQQNQREATAATAQVKMLLDRFDPEEIGVIAAYSAQEALIREQLETLPEDGSERVQVATIDRFQGSEKEAIVVSFTRSNEGGYVGFLSTEDGPNRLNVALTRARQYCALVGDWDTLRVGSSLYDRLYQSVDGRFETKHYTEDDLTELSRRLS